MYAPVGNETAMRFPQLAFPEHDPNWSETLAFVRLRWPDARCLAPAAFCTRLPQAFPLAWSFWEDLREFRLVILHKGQLDLLHAGFLRRCLRYRRYVFGNEVFCVFADPALAKGLGEGPPFHLQLKEALAGWKASARRTWRLLRGERLRCLVASARGMGNLGDDSTACAAQLLLEEALPGCEVRHTGPPPQRAMVEDADLVVLGGGGLLYDSCYDNARNYTQYLLWAREMGKPALCLGIGTQGIRSSLGQELFRQALSGPGPVHVRSRKDLELLRDEVGVQCAIEVGQDLAFSLPLPDRLPRSARKRPLLYYVLVDASRLRAARTLRSYLEAARAVYPLLERRFEIACVVQSEDDLELYRSLPHSQPLRLLRLDPTTAIAAYQQADLVLSARFHGVVFAALAGTPVISVSSRGPKIHRLLSEALPSLQPGLIPITEFSAARLESKLALFDRDPAQLTADPQQLQRCRSLARSAIDVIRRRLGRPHL